MKQWKTLCLIITKFFVIDESKLRTTWLAVVFCDTDLTNHQEHFSAATASKLASDEVHFSSE